MFNQISLEEIAAHLLDLEPHPIIELRLRRDVLHQPLSELHILKSEIDSNPWVQQLIQEQHPNGSWGRFHSRDSQFKQKIITTEVGVDRGLALGLDASHPVFCRTVDYLTQLLGSQISFPDPAESNDRWPVGVQLFTAATLSKLKPNHPSLNDVWDLWHQIASQTFAAGKYDPDAEIQVHKALTGATIKDSYLVIRNKYALTLLSAHTENLSDKLQTDILAWIWDHPEGVNYLGVQPSIIPTGVNPGYVDRWFSTHELLSCFPAWKAKAAATLEWLWSQRGDDGIWDFGLRSTSSHYLPLSPSWRNPIYRKIDWSVRVLMLLSKYVLSADIADSIL